MSGYDGDGGFHGKAGNNFQFSGMSFQFHLIIMFGIGMLHNFPGHLLDVVDDILKSTNRFLFAYEC